ncbi:MAG: hydrogenase maturation protease [Tepidisphaeraceae bacterium]|jgi:hydrogenase maturation protease
MSQPLLILCFGNPLAGDDAFGFLVASQLAALHNPRLHVVDLSRESPSAMLDHLDSQPALVIVDAVSGPDIAPGQLIDIDWHAPGRPSLVHDSALSTHGLSVANQLELAARLGMLPASIRLIGAGIADTAIGAAPSPAIPAAAAEAVKRILNLAGQP